MTYFSVTTAWMGKPESVSIDNFLLEDALEANGIRLVCTEYLGPTILYGERCWFWIDTVLPREEIEKIFLLFQFFVIDIQEDKRDY